MINAATICSQNLLANFTKTEGECALASASVTIISGVQPMVFLWSNGASTAGVSDLEVGNYWVKVRDGQLKDTTIVFSIEKTPCEPIPENHFTPNNDDFNDTWNISRIEHFPDFELFVYNRWGQLVHQQRKQFTPWDGTSFSSPVPDATYYYILYPSKSDKQNLIKGDVSIIR